jgi:putative flippase GtrA
MTLKSDLLLNIVSETFGVILSVIVAYFVIDRYLKRKEEQRWEEVRGRVYERIFRLTELFLQLALLPIQYKSQNATLNIATPEDYALYLKKNITDWTLFEWNNYKISLKDFTEKLDRILNVYQSQISPDILEKLYELEDKLDYLKNLCATIPPNEQKFKNSPHTKALLKQGKIIEKMILFYKSVYKLSFEVK